ncbi:hypothetical protein [Chitinophaga lutea]|nr:hypothetical protein [Chitinophaga lutea]
MDEVTRRMLEKIHQPGLFDALVKQLSASELNTVLLDVFNQRVAGLDAAALLQKYMLNRFVKPAAVDVIRLKEEELQILRLLQKEGFEPLELSPVTQLGACAVVAAVNQKKVISALRNTEVLSDPTNAMALLYTEGKKSGGLPAQTYRYCAITRTVRAQALDNPAFAPHFAVCALATMTCAGAGYIVETTALCEHVMAQEAILRQVFGLNSIRVHLLPQKGHGANHALVGTAMELLQRSRPAIAVTVRERDETKNYYTGIQFKLIADLQGEPFEIGDGGLVDWTQQLLSDKSQRMFISGLGTQVLHQLGANNRLSFPHNP